MAPSEPHAASLESIALAALADALPAGVVEASTAEASFLSDRRARATLNQRTWMAALTAARDCPQPQDARLWQVAEQLGLGECEVLSIALAATVERNPMAGRALAYLQAPVGGSRPTVGLLARALAPLVDGADTVLGALAGGAARRSGFLALEPGGVPLAERIVVLPDPISAALQLFDVPVPGVELDLQAEPVPLAESIIDTARGHAQVLAQLPGAGLVIRSACPAEARTLAAQIADDLDLRPAFLDAEPPVGFVPWALLHCLLPVFCVELSPSEHRLLPDLPHYMGPLLVLCGPEGHVSARSHTLTRLAVPVPSPEERSSLWLQALGDTELATDLGSVHRHSAGRIAELGRAVQYRAAVAAHERPRREDLLAAAHGLEGQGLGSLAQPVPDRVDDQALVIGERMRNQFDALLARCQRRDGLAERLGPALQARYRPGVCALFVGRSGTGKTLGVSWLATRLGIPLYRVDVASVLSKYIGETEKNLAQLLAEAEQAEIILLFDEADSLFAQRTEVKQSNDRFANTQTNYLLQRIETYDGIAILTSNSRSRFDTAFSRRLDMIIDFPVPSPAERRRLWLAHLGGEHGLRGRELNRIAAVAELCGGHIRNAVLTAAVCARDRNRAIQYADVLLGLEVEYRKLEREMPSMLLDAGAGP